MQIIDASAIIDLVARTPRGSAVRRSIRNDDEIFAPELVDAEVLSGIARQERAQLISTSDANDAVARFGALSLTRVTATLLRDRAWQLRHRVRVSDAFYVACAELLKVPLVTTDARLSRAPIPGITVTLVS